MPPVQIHRLGNLHLRHLGEEQKKIFWYYSVARRIGCPPHPSGEYFYAAIFKGNIRGRYDDATPEKPLRCGW